MADARPHIEASRRVASIMRAAEDAANEIREEAERRADARIAEAARAADIRVAAAEEEAEELLADCVDGEPDAWRLAFYRLLDEFS